MFRPEKEEDEGRLARLPSGAGAVPEGRDWHCCCCGQERHFRRVVEAEDGSLGTRLELAAAGVCR